MCLHGDAGTPNETHGCYYVNDSQSIAEMTVDANNQPETNDGETAPPPTLKDGQSLCRPRVVGSEPDRGGAANRQEPDRKVHTTLVPTSGKIH